MTNQEYRRRVVLSLQTIETESSEHEMGLVGDDVMSEIRRKLFDEFIDGALTPDVKRGLDAMNVVGISPVQAAQYFHVVNTTMTRGK